MILLLAGCKAPPSKVIHKGPPPKPEPRDVSIEVGTAEFTQYGDKPVRHKLWTLQWKEAKFDVKEGIRPSGVLENVDATVYDEDSGVTSIHADRGVADRNSPIVSLERNVIAKSAARDARLTCDALKWDPDRRLLIATGNVRYHWASMDAGPFPELWASPDMERFGTPDTFKQEGVVKK